MPKIVLLGTMLVLFQATIATGLRGQEAPWGPSAAGGSPDVLPMNIFHPAPIPTPFSDSPSIVPSVAGPSFVSQPPARPQAQPDANNSSPRPTQSENDALARRLSNLEAAVQTLQRGAADALEPGRKRSTDVPRVEDTKATPDYPKIKLTGFFQADAGWFDQDAASVATLGDIEDVAGFRRARLAAVGDVAENVGYLLEMDFAFPGRPNFADVWVDVHDLPVLGNFRVGQWRQPFHMDALTSVRELTFFERPLSFAFVPFRQIGIGCHDTAWNENVTWAFSAIRFPTDPWGNIGSSGGVGNLGDRGYGSLGRITALVLGYDDCGPLIHLGADFAHLAPGDHLINYRAQPEFGGPFVGLTGNSPSVPFFVSTGAVPTDTIQLYDAELGARLGSLYGQTEITYAVVNDLAGNVLTFPGYYGQIGYFLTGEVRPYNRVAGVFGRVKPLEAFGRSGGRGAWEIAGRYSHIDLNQISLLAPTVPGGRLSDVTIGLNWYLNQYMKFQFNYIHAFLDRGPQGTSNTDIYAVRVQLDF
jgi:phosphate-selective porin OprO/OprP